VFVRVYRLEISCPFLLVVSASFSVLSSETLLNVAFLGVQSIVCRSKSTRAGATPRSHCKQSKKSGIGKLPLINLEMQYFITPLLWFFVMALPSTIMVKLKSLAELKQAAKLFCFILTFYAVMIALRFRDTEIFNVRPDLFL